MSTSPLLCGSRPAEYAGDVAPEEAWRILCEDQAAVLVDVRTKAEWGFVGIPDLSSIGKDAILQEWVTYPTMERHANFETGLIGLMDGLHVSKSSPIFFLCRSGGRSQGAAMALSMAGYECCYNIKDGFEGPKNDAGHRGSLAGWKASGLPWQQQ